MEATPREPALIPLLMLLLGRFYLTSLNIKLLALNFLSSRLINPELRELILQRRSSAEIKTAAVKTMTTMHQDALQKAAEGITTLEEIVRVSSGDGLE